MNPFKNRPLLFCSLIVYTLALTALLLYLRFPTEDFKLFCQVKLEQLLPESQCSIGDLRYKFPVSMEMNKITFKDRQKKPQTLLTLDQVTIRPELTAPISGCRVDLKAYGGEHDLSIFTNKSKQTVNLKNVHLSHLDLAKIPLIRQTFKREIIGSLSGSGMYQTTWSSGKPVSSGQGSLVIEEGSFSLRFPILSLKKIDLKELKADFVLQKDTIQFSEGHFQGKELKGDFGGDITLRVPFIRSELAFNGAMEPLPPLLKKSKNIQNMVIQLEKQHNRSTLPFLLQGNVETPRFKFDS